MGKEVLYVLVAKEYDNLSFDLLQIYDTVIEAEEDAELIRRAGSHREISVLMVERKNGKNS